MAIKVKKLAVNMSIEPIACHSYIINKICTNLYTLAKQNYFEDTGLDIYAHKIRERFLSLPESRCNCGQRHKIWSQCTSTMQHKLPDEASNNLDHDTC